MAAEMFRLLNTGDVVLADDEFLDDDGITWLSAERWTIGRPWHNGLKPMRREVSALLALPVGAYALPDGSAIERCSQRDGTFKWAIRKNGACLNREGELEWEPLPSSRNADFYARCRYESAEAAYAFWLSTTNQLDAAG